MVSVSWVIFSGTFEDQGTCRGLEKDRYCTCLPKGDRALELLTRQLTFSARDEVAAH